MPKTWIALHIFYASNQNPLLLEAVEPLVQDLRERGLIQRFFFIKYWQEGPHVRLRLLPAEGADEEEIKQRAETAISAYLKRRPALYNAADESIAPFYKDIFVWEYGQDKWDEKYGSDGTMPIQPNNCMQFATYEPEHGRYGGEEGVQLAEWHFEKSSEIILKLIRKTNLHVRTIMLGQSIQLALLFCLAFMGSDEEIIGFLKRYIEMWNGPFVQRGSDSTPTMEKIFWRMAPRLQHRARELHQYVIEGIAGPLTPVELEWLEHIRELRRRLDVLFAAGVLVFTSRQAGPEPFVADNPVMVRGLLLGSYLHMMNNRLGVMIPDEIPLAYMLSRTLEEKLHLVQETVQ